MTLSRSNPRAKPRWFALLTIVVLFTGLAATSVLAADPVAANFTFTVDDQGQNDEPGQKDLTAQSSLNFDGSFYTAWKWDDIAWNGNNTGDGCSLFDTNDDGFVEYAVCATVIGKDPVTLLSVSVYSCNNKWADRCGNPVLRFATTSAAQASTYCTVYDEATGTFPIASPDKDTLIICNITELAAASTPPITDLVAGTLLNTCSYPSREPNSDPSDCVLTPTAADTSITTSATSTWSVTLQDTATLNPSTATGSVVFNLWGDATCSTLVWTSAAITLDSNGQATTPATGGTPNIGPVITNTTVDGDGIYYWTVDYSPTGLFNPSASSCGDTNETIQINLPVTTTS
jgi:hypothetical protein